MNPLIIVATPNNCWLHPEVKYPKTVSELVEEAAKCREAGAAVLHTHGLADIGEDCCTKGEGKWIEVMDETRKACDILIQCGMSTLTLQQRIDVFEHKADMVSIILNHHDEDFAECNTDVLHPMEELVEYAQACRKYRVKPEFEVWHSGSIWNLNRLIEQGNTRATLVISEHCWDNMKPFDWRKFLNDNGKTVYPGEPISAEYLASILKRKCGGAEVRSTVIGYTQRGAQPTAQDSAFAFEAGHQAVQLLNRGIANQAIGIRHGRVFNMPIIDALSMKKTFDREMYNLINKL